MRVISILSQADDQTVARPFSRASSNDELVELLRAYVPRITLANIDTETPVGEGIRFGQRVRYFAFTER